MKSPPSPFYIIPADNVFYCSRLSSCTWCGQCFVGEGEFGGKMLAFPMYRNISSVLFKVRLHMMCATHPNIVQIIEVFANSVQFPHESSPR